MAKWIAAEKARAEPRYVVVCPNVTGRTKERISQSERTRAGSLAVVDLLPVARTCFLQADVVLSFSGVTIVLFLLCFRVFLLFVKAELLLSIVTRYTFAPAAKRSFLTTVCALSCLASFCFFLFHERCHFSLVFCTLAVSIFCMESTPYVFLPHGACLPCGHGLNFEISLLYENPVNRSSNQSNSSTSPRLPPRGGGIKLCRSEARVRDREGQ